MTSIYRPRMAATIRVPIVGSIAQRIAMAATDSVVEIPVRIHSASYVRNDHNHADSCKFSAAWFDAGIDPRIFSQCTCRLWLGTAGYDGTWSPTDKDLRFAGVVTRIGRGMQSEASGFTVDLEFDDYTALFLESKPYPPEGVPDFNQTLSQAWARICDHTGPLLDDGNISSTVTALRDHIVFRGAAEDVLVGRAVPARIRKHGKIVVKPETDAWAVWQQVVGSVGLMSYIHVDQCIVTTARDYYTKDKPPALVFGQNIATISEAREIKFAGKGVIITAFDPLTGTTLEAFYPPIGDSRIVHKNIGAVRATRAAGSRKRVPATADLASFYDPPFEVSGVSDQAALDAIAERAWEERSRQELEGVVTTSEMVIQREDGSDFDLLGLAGGDALVIHFDPEHLFEISQLTDYAARIARAVELGYSEQVAEVITRNLGEYAKLDATFHVKTVGVHAECASGTDDGEFEIEIHFVNRIEVDQSGNTVKPKNTLLKAMADPAGFRTAIKRAATGSPDKILTEREAFILALTAMGKTRAEAEFEADARAGFDGGSAPWRP